MFCGASPTRNFNCCCHSFLLFVIFLTPGFIYYPKVSLKQNVKVLSSVSQLGSDKGWLIIDGMDAMGLISYNSQQSMHVSESPSQEVL